MANQIIPQHTETDPTLEQLERLADALQRSNPQTMAHALRAYSAQSLQLRLGVDRLGLVRLRMCKVARTPDAVAYIARYAGCDAGALAALMAEAAHHER